jgi:hypothetical protein
MSNLGLLRPAIATIGLFTLTASVGLAAPPADGTAEPTVTTLTPTDSPSVPGEAQNCRYKPLPGSHIKVQVCTSREGLQYRMDRRARTIAVVIPGMPVSVSAPVAAPLPQVQ